MWHFLWLFVIYVLFAEFCCKKLKLINHCGQFWNSWMNSFRHFWVCKRVYQNYCSYRISCLYQLHLIKTYVTLNFIRGDRLDHTYLIDTYAYYVQPFDQFLADKCSIRRGISQKNLSLLINSELLFPIGFSFCLPSLALYVNR